MNRSLVRSKGKGSSNLKSTTSYKDIKRESSGKKKKEKRRKKKKKSYHTESSSSFCEKDVNDSKNNLRLSSSYTETDDNTWSGSDTETARNYDTYDNTELEKFLNQYMGEDNHTVKKGSFEETFPEEKEKDKRRYTTPPVFTATRSLNENSLEGNDSVSNTIDEFVSLTTSTRHSRHSFMSSHDQDDVKLSKSKSCVRKPKPKLLRSNTVSHISEISNLSPRSKQLRKKVLSEYRKLSDGVSNGKIVPRPVIDIAELDRSDTQNEETPSSDLSKSDSAVRRIVKNDSEILERDIYGFLIPDKYKTLYKKWLEKRNQTVTQRIKPFIELKSGEDEYGNPLKIRISNLIHLIDKGIPENQRGFIWKILLDVEDKMNVNWCNYYQRLIDEDEEHTVGQEFLEQIDKDLHRTFDGEMICFYPEFQKKLREVLVCYAKHNKTVGYNQAMNFIAGSFLLFMDCQPAFWCLRHVVEDLLPGYFTGQMTGLIVDMVVFCTYLKGYLRKLSRHFTKCGFGIQMIINQWFATLFFKNLPAETTFRIWDLLFYRGIQVMFEYGLRILSHLERKLLKCKDVGTIMMTIMNGTAGIYDFEALSYIPIEPPIRNGDIKIHRFITRMRIEKSENIHNIF